MNDLNIQGSKAYAATYATNAVKTQPAAPATTTAPASSQNNSDTVSISAKAQELFQQSNVTTNSSSPSYSGSIPTNDNSSDTGILITTNPDPVTPMNGGGGVRPPENP